jgi:hypothetical protein
MLGGIMLAKVPAEATQAAAKVLSYLYLSISGRTSFPKIAVFASEEPEIAPKIAEPKQVATASDPGQRLVSL